MFSLDQTNSGRQPMASSLMQVGVAYYYLAYAGGTNVIPGVTPTGAGVIGKLSFDVLGQPSLTTVCHLPGYYVSFPPCDAVPDGTNVIDFNTVGTSTNPGAIAKFDLVSKQLTTLFTFPTNAVSVTNYGKQPYSTPVLYNNELYFTTLAGGTGGKGVLEKLSLAVPNMAAAQSLPTSPPGGSPFTSRLMPGESTRLCRLGAGRLCASIWRPSPSTPPSPSPTPTT